MVTKDKFQIVNLMKPKDVVQVLNNRWFWCIDGDPTKGIMYKKYSPQCNNHKGIAEKFPVKNIFPDAKLVFIEECFVPWDTSQEY